MSRSTNDVVRDGLAPLVTRCVVLGEGENVRIGFLSGDDADEPSVLLSAVTLTRAQLTGFAGMVAAVLDADDPYATSAN